MDPSLAFAGIAIAVSIAGHAIVVGLQIFKSPKEGISDLAAEMRGLRAEYNASAKQLERHDATLIQLDRSITRLIERFDKMEQGKRNARAR